MLELLKNKKIMLVVAHPDDEVLGVGATMNKLISECGCEVHVVILGEGITSRSEVRDELAWENELKLHRENIKKAQNIIGYKSVSIYNLPDNRFDSIALLDIIKIIEKEKEGFNPDMIFTHHGGDLNIDHQLTFDAVITCCRPMETEIVKHIITFETMSGTEWRATTDPKVFIPNFFISISDRNLQAKVDAMESYYFEKRKFPHPRSPEALKIVAQRWGISVGVYLAEAFTLVRSIS